MIDVFDEVKTRVPVPEAAQYYGYSPNRAGFISCPFHHERTPSLKLKPASWKCYGCGAGGSVIDFTAKLFDLAPLDAVRRINDDFSLGLPLDRKQIPEDRAAADRRRHKAAVRRRFDEWREETLGRLCAAFRMANMALGRAPDTWSPEEAEAVRWASALEYWLDELEAGDLAAQMSILDDWKGVEARCRRILNGMPRELKLA